jgi:hypothetical protein
VSWLPVYRWVVVMPFLIRVVTLPARIVLSPSCPLGSSSLYVVVVPLRESLSSLSRAS